MATLDELTERLTIEFPIPITADEVEGSFFDFLRDEAECNIDYMVQIRGHKNYGLGAADERYPQKISGSMRRSHIFSTFEMPTTGLDSPYAVFLKGIAFQSLGADTIRELESLPSGKEQLELMDRVRQKTQEYFSHRPK